MPAASLPDLANMRSVLVVGHPGHELRVHRWLELARPEVFVLTDGSGRTQQSRLASTAKVLAAAGATPAGVFGRFSDRDVYAMIQAMDAAPLVEILQDVASKLESDGIDCVVGDAMEGFNPTHDLCRVLVNGAVSLVQRRTGRAVTNLDFLLDGSPAASLESRNRSIVRVELDADAFDRKIASALGYPELSAEVQAALSRFGRQAFSTEILREVDDASEGLDGMPEEPPLYERFGEQRVAAQHYQDVIRYRQHVQPFVRLMWRQAGLLTGSADTTTTEVSAQSSRAGSSSHLTSS
jgi:hypothetical protein